MSGVMKDKQLEERAKDLTTNADEDRYSGNSYYEATLERLKDNRESLRLLKYLDLYVKDYGDSEDISEAIIAHITILQTLLGQTEAKPDQPNK